MRNLWYVLGAVATAAVLVATGGALLLPGEDAQNPVATGTVDGIQTATPAATSAVQPTAQAMPTASPLLPFPDNVVMVVAHGGYAHGSGGYFSVTRHYRDKQGALRTDELLVGQEEGAEITGVVANELGELFVSACFGEFCGYESGTEGSNTVLTRSTDGGKTWREIGSRAGKWSARTAVDEGVVVINFEGQAPTYALFPGGTPIVPPAAAHGSINPVVFRGQLAWMAGAQILNRNGERLYKFELPGYPNLRVQSVVALRPPGSMLPFPNIAASWSADGLPGQEQFFVGTFLPPIGLPLKVLQVERGAPRLAGWLNERSLLVTADYVRPGTCTSEGMTAGADPAIIPYDLGRLSFIGTPFYAADCSRGTQLVVSTQFIGIWTRVKGGATASTSGPTHRSSLGYWIASVTARS